MEMQRGDQVRSVATGETGVALKLPSDGFVEVSFPSGVFTLHVDEVEPVADVPVEQLRGGQLGHSRPYGLRLRALYLKHAYRYDPLSGLSNARIEPQLHQIYVAHRVVSKLQPRMILADEVGLGKTVEAGLILKELRARELVDRVLVIVPASLQLQWLNELRSKFNEEFQIIDGDAAKYLEKLGDNPYAQVSNAISSITFARTEKRREQITDVPWDMVIVDEAHRVRRRLQGRSPVTTKVYELTDELKDLADGLLLLTATPMQLDTYELWSLIELVEPGLYPDFLEYERYRENLPDLNELMIGLDKWNALSGSDREALLGTHRARLHSLVDGRRMTADVLEAEEVRTAVMDRLVDEHPLVRVLVRNRKAEVGGFMPREASRVLVDLTAEELDLYAQVSSYLRDGYNRAVVAKQQAIGFLMVTYHKMLASSTHAIRRSLQRRKEKLQEQVEAVLAAQKRAAEYDVEGLRETLEASEAIQDLERLWLDPEELEKEIRDLKRLVGRLGSITDSKAHALLEVVDAVFEPDPDERVLIFTQFLETQRFLEQLLSGNDYRVAIFNGSMSRDEKEEAVRAFRHGGQIMVSSEAGGEGRNFQFCHIVVNYDLPWNPMKVEQRIGRVDRIGQKRPVQIFNLASRGTVEERVLEVLEHRIDLFEQTVGSLDPILGDVEADIENLVMRPPEEWQEAFAAWEIDVERRVQEARETERKLADFVLDRASLRRDRANELLERSPLARTDDLQTHVAASLEYFGGMLTESPDGEVTITLSPNLASRLKVAEQIQRGVFDPEAALELEHLDFLAFGHELVEGILALPIGEDSVVTAARVVPGDPAGTWVEVFYEIQAHGVHPRGRFLRHLVNEAGEVREEEIRSLPPLGRAAHLDGVPSWLGASLEASRRLALQRLEALRREVRQEHEEAKVEQTSLAQRLYEYRRKRLEHGIDTQKKRIQELESTGSAQQKKILPALQGQVNKKCEQLERLDSDHEWKMKKIEEKQPDVRLRAVAAGLVVGE